MGGSGLEAFFLFGVDGLPLVAGSMISGATFLFLLIFATLGGVAPSVVGLGSSLIAEETALMRADRLEGIANVLDVIDDNEGMRAVFCPSDKGRWSLKAKKIAAVMDESKACHMWLKWVIDGERCRKG